MNNIMKKLMEVSENMEIYYNIYKDTLNLYENTNRNYKIINNINEINNNINIIKEKKISFKIINVAISIKFIYQSYFFKRFL
jgi:hypothetical protein